MDGRKAAYLDKVQSFIDSLNIQWSIPPTDVRALWTDGSTVVQDIEPANIIRQVIQTPQSQACVVIQNISPSLIAALGVDWEIDPNFFATHAMSPTIEDMWTSKKDQVWSGGSKKQPWSFLDGIWEYDRSSGDLRTTSYFNSTPSFFPRHCWRDSKGVHQSHTRVSYCRVKTNLYLFLVDPPLNLLKIYNSRDHKAVPTLRFPYTINQGGLLFPGRHLQAYTTLYGSFKDFFQHAWHFDLLFEEKSGAFPSVPLLYLMLRSLWESNLSILSTDIRLISFRNIRDPSVGTNNVLHDRREDLANLKSGLMETIRYAPVNITGWFEQQIERNPKALSRGSIKRQLPLDDLQRLHDEAIALESFLMETFQLLMSSISIRDNQLSIEQTNRATRLTQLAFIYIPLSFVTGIFGMNIKEINGSGLHIWVFFVTIVIAIAATVLLFFGLNFNEKRKVKRMIELKPLPSVD